MADLTKLMESRSKLKANVTRQHNKVMDAISCNNSTDVVKKLFQQHKEAFRKFKTCHLEVLEGLDDDVDISTANSYFQKVDSEHLELVDAVQQYCDGDCVSQSSASKSRSGSKKSHPSSSSSSTLQAARLKAVEASAALELERKLAELNVQQSQANHAWIDDEAKRSVQKQALSVELGKRHLIDAHAELSKTELDKQFVRSRKIAELEVSKKLADEQCRILEETVDEQATEAQRNSLLDNDEDPTENTRDWVYNSDLAQINYPRDDKICDNNKYLNDSIYVSQCKPPIENVPIVSLSAPPVNVPVVSLSVPKVNVPTVNCVPRVSSYVPNISSHIVSTVPNQVVISKVSDSSRLQNAVLLSTTSLEAATKENKNCYINGAPQPCVSKIFDGNIIEHVSGVNKNPLNSGGISVNSGSISDNFGNTTTVDSRANLGAHLISTSSMNQFYKMAVPFGNSIHVGEIPVENQTGQNIIVSNIDRNYYEACN